MCVHRRHGVGQQPRANIYNRTSAFSIWHVDDGVHVSVYTTALRRFIFGMVRFSCLWGLLMSVKKQTEC